MAGKTGRPKRKTKKQTLKLEFTGLFACVLPDEPQPKAMDIVAIKGESAGLGCHRPLLAVDLKYLGYWDHADGLMRLPKGQVLAFWDVTDCEVLFLPDGTQQTGLAFIDSLKADVTHPSKQDDQTAWKDFGWLPNLGFAYKDARVSPRHLKKPLGANTPVAGLIRVTGASFYCGIPRKDLRRVIWEFAPGDPKGTAALPRRALTDRACVQLKYERSLIIKMIRFDGRGIREVIFRPENTEATFSCLAGDFGGAHHPGQPPGITIDHFRAVYELMETPPPLAERPIPRLSSSARPSSPRVLWGGGSADCPPSGAKAGRS